MDVSGNVTTLAGKARQMGTPMAPGHPRSFENPSNIRWAGRRLVVPNDNASIRKHHTGRCSDHGYTRFRPVCWVGREPAGIVLATDLPTRRQSKIDLTANTVATIATGFENPVGIALAAPSSSARRHTYVAERVRRDTRGDFDDRNGEHSSRQSGVADTRTERLCAQFYLPT